MMIEIILDLVEKYFALAFLVALPIIFQSDLFVGKINKFRLKIFFLRITNKTLNAFYDEAI